MAWDTEYRLPKASFLTPEQTAGVRALFRAIQPSDPERGIPGAVDCDAAEFLGLLLARDDDDPVKVHYDLPKWRADYPVWLANLDLIARQRFGAPLAEIDVVQATTIVAELEAGTLAGFTGNQRSAFVTLWRHCLQGCWSDPRWGGNRDRIMWRWLGHLYDPQKVPVGTVGGGNALDR